MTADRVRGIRSFRSEKTGCEGGARTPFAMGAENLTLLPSRAKATTAMVVWAQYLGLAVPVAITHMARCFSTPNKFRRFGSSARHTVMQAVIYNVGRPGAPAPAAARPARVGVGFSPAEIGVTGEINGGADPQGGYHHTHE